jgi:hypothetical protein
VHVCVCEMCNNMCECGIDQFIWQKTIKKIMQHFHVSEELKINEEALSAVTYLVSLYAMEIVLRSSQSADSRQAVEVDVDSVERVMTQIFSDFQ